MPSTPRRNGWQWTDTVLADTTSAPLMMPETVHNPISVGVFPGVGGTARIEYSISNVVAVKDGLAKWHVWPFGDVSVNVTDSLDGQVTALRLVAVTTNANWEVLV